ncbi:unnamed protein product [Discosporangium mesarthrocarpum]
MKGTALLLAGCIAVGPASSFHVGIGRGFTPSASGSTPARSLKTGTRMAVDPAVVHSVGEYVNAISPLDFDHSWVSQVMHGLSDAAVATGDAVQEEVKKPGPFGQWINFIKSSVLEINSFYKGIGIEQSFGLAIITFTLSVKTLLVPLQFIQLQSSERMQALQPTIKEINKKFGANKESAQAATSRLYESAKVNPLIGCLPALVQFPVFVGLYRAIITFGQETVANEPFLWVPCLQGPTFDAGRGIGWLTHNWVNNVPPLGWHDTLCYLSIPAILVVSQKLSMALTAPPIDESDEQSSSIQTVLQYLPILIGWFSLNVPSALGVYWLTNNLSTTAVTQGIKFWFKMNPPEMEIPDDILSAPTREYALPTVAEALDDARVGAWPDRTPKRRVAT